MKYDLESFDSGLVYIGLHAMTTPQLRTCVAAGRFNPAILSPGWLVAHKILPEGEGEMGALVGTNLIQYSLAGFTWTPTLTKLEVVADSPDANPGEFLTQVLTLLSHTPVTAVGSNFAFQVPDDQGQRIYPLIASQLSAVLADSDHEMLDYSAAIALKFDEDCSITVDLASERESINTVRFNFNRLVRDANAGAGAARKWLSDEAEAKRLYQKILGAR